jgi:hypothetical protein
MVYGNTIQGYLYAGFLKKHQAIPSHGQTMIPGDEGLLIYHRSKVFAWNSYCSDAGAEWDIICLSGSMGRDECNEPGSGGDAGNNACLRQDADPIRRNLRWEERDILDLTKII